MVLHNRSYVNLCLFKIIIIFTLLVISDGLLAQKSYRVITTFVGASPYDLSGTGTAPVIGVAIDTPLTSFLVVEPGLRFLRYNTQFNTDISYLLPEISIKLQNPTTLLSPYIGIGAGVATRLEGGNKTDLTLHITVGVRVQLGSKWSVRTEARVRSINPWSGNTTDLTLGIGHSL